MLSVRVDRVQVGRSLRGVPGMGNDRSGLTLAHHRPDRRRRSRYRSPADHRRPDGRGALRLDRHRRARSRPRGWRRARWRHPPRWRAGRGQIDTAPGHGSSLGRGGSHRPLRLRRGVGHAGAHAGRPHRRLEREPLPCGRHRPRFGPRHHRVTQAVAAHRRLSPRPSGRPRSTGFRAESPRYARSPPRSSREPRRSTSRPSWSAT